MSNLSLISPDYLNLRNPCNNQMVPLRTQQTILFLLRRPRYYATLSPSLISMD